MNNQTPSPENELKVSVVCSWYNRPEYIKETLDSLLNQNFEAYEIILANDGSPDPRVKEILDTYTHPRITIIHKDNEGFTTTIKKLIEIAKAPYIAIQGAGEVSLADRLASQYALISRSENTGLVGCSSTNVLKKTGSKDQVLKENKLSDQLTKVTAQAQQLPFTHGSMMINKAAYQTLGGYRTEFKYAQDYDLFLRMAEHYDCYAMPENLYQRNLFLDGVATQPIKSFEQSLYVKLAKKCSRFREKQGFDPLDRYGNLYLSLNQLDFKDRLNFYKLIAKLLYSEQFQQAKELLEAADFGGVNWLLGRLLPLLEKSPLALKLFKLPLKTLFAKSVFVQSNQRT